MLKSIGNAIHGTLEAVRRLLDPISRRWLGSPLDDVQAADDVRREVARVRGAVGEDEAHLDLTHYHTDNYRFIFYDALPSALSALEIDSSPSAQVCASVTYNMVVEGVLAETGYHAFFTMLE